MQKSLDGKVVLIAGATGGLGTAVTAAFLDAGARVTAVDRVVHQDQIATPQFAAVAADLMVAGGKVAVQGVVERWGRVDTLVHLVGGYAGGKSVSDSDDALFDHMMNMNVRTAFHVFRAVLPVMRAQGVGHILAIGARAAVEPSPMSGLYGASKAALVSLIRTIAAENADLGITANVILPSTLDTEANRESMPSADFSRWVAPAQVANMLVHLAGDGASAVNGAVIPIYGRA